MKCLSFFSIALFVAGGFLGGLGVLLYSDIHTEDGVDEHILARVLVHSNQQISPNNFSCEGDTKKNVGAVFASLYARRSPNEVKYACYNVTCALSVSDCTAWQGSECNTRFLKFEVGELNEILFNSFTCIDMP